MLWYDLRLLLKFVLVHDPLWRETRMETNKANANTYLCWQTDIVT